MLAHAQHDEGLQCLAQPHVIGQTGTETVMGQGRQPAHPLLLIVPQRPHQLVRARHLLLPLLLKVLPGGIPLGGDDGEQQGERIGQLVVDALLVIQHGPQHGEPLHQLVAQHQAGLLVELDGALARRQLAQDQAQIEDLVLIEGEGPSTWNQS